MTSATTKRPPLPTGVLFVLAASAAHSLGAMAMAVALGKVVFDLTGRALDLGLLGLAEFLPTALLAPLVGSAADRFDRRQVVAVGFTLEAAVYVALAAYVGAAGSSAPVWPIFALAVGFGTARATVAPAIRALPADLAGDQLARVIPLSSASWQLSMILGPVIGGMLLVVGRPWPFAVSAAGLLVGIVLVSRVPDVRPMLEAARAQAHAERAEGDEPGPLREALEGLAFVRRTPILLGAISLDLFAVLFGGAVALLPAIAETRLGVGAIGLGWLRAATGIGAGLTTLLLAWRPVDRRVGRVLLVAVAVFGGATLVLAATRTYAVAFVALLVLSAADAISVFIRGTLVPLVTPPVQRGRVLATENVFIGASNELGAFESGVAGQLMGVSGAVALGGVATLAIVGLWWILFPALRDVDRFGDVAAPALPTSEL
ncbi:MAG: MFS transporter [Acidimicrobiales bacterium]